MNPRDLVDEGIAAGALEWVPDELHARAPRDRALQWTCPGCGTRWAEWPIREHAHHCDACGTTWHAPRPTVELIEAAQRAALGASEAPAPRPGALLDALCAMLQAFPEARNADQDRARRAGLDALDMLCGFAQPAHVVELARAVAFHDQCMAQPEAGEVGALRDAHAWIIVAARNLVRGAT